MSKQKVSSAATSELTAVALRGYKLLVADIKKSAGSKEAVLNAIEDHSRLWGNTNE